MSGAANLLSAALSQSTVAIYHRAWQRFTTFSRSVSITPHLPALPSTIALYISSLVSPPDNASPATIATNLSAIAYWHKLFNYQDPTSTFIVRKIMQGVAKTKQAADLRIPITPPMLASILRSADTIAQTVYERVLVPAMFTSMFHAFMRIGEATLSPHNIQYHQVVLSDAAASITFMSFKHHHGHPITINIPATGVPNSCPVQTIRTYMLARGTRPGPFFCNMDNTPITAQKFRTMLRFALAHAGLSGFHITPHSFRIGAATYAAAMGLSSQQIQAMGRWKSSAFQKYVRISSITIQPNNPSAST